MNGFWDIICLNNIYFPKNALHAYMNGSQQKTKNKIEIDVDGEARYGVGGTISGTTKTHLH